MEDDLLAKAANAAEELYNIRDTYFPVDPSEKSARLQSESDLALQLLNSIPPEDRKSPTQRATYEYLRGKVLDVFSEYRKEAEDHLSKAVKLNPSLGDAWLSLGNCIWKKGDLSAAKNCFMLALSKGPNKRILCQLSMLERKMAQGVENQAEMVEESIMHAKEAITLDVKDGNSWLTRPALPRFTAVRTLCQLDVHAAENIITEEWLFPGYRSLYMEISYTHRKLYLMRIQLIDNLGNAYLTSFFITGAWDHSKLLQSLKAYQNAERDERMNSNPDLYFNCATVNKYLENYERALTGFQAAATKDPTLYATEEVDKIVRLLDKLESLLKGQTKAKRLASLTSSLTYVKVNPSYKRVHADNLLEGLNKGAAVVGKVLFFVKHQNVTPLYYLLCDTNQTCYVLTIYGIHGDGVKEGDEIILLDPYYRDVGLSWEEKNYHFKSVRVDFLEQLLVNGKALSHSHAVRASIYAQHKP